MDSLRRRRMESQISRFPPGPKPEGLGVRANSEPRCASKASVSMSFLVTFESLVRREKLLPRHERTKNWHDPYFVARPACWHMAVHEAPQNLSGNSLPRSFDTHRLHILCGPVGAPKQERLKSNDDHDAFLFSTDCPRGTRDRCGVSHASCVCAQTQKDDKGPQSPKQQSQSRQRSERTETLVVRMFESCRRAIV